MFDLQPLLPDLDTFVSMRTVVFQNYDEYRSADAWIRGFGDPMKTEFTDFPCRGLNSTLTSLATRSDPRASATATSSSCPATTASSSCARATEF